MPRHKSRIACGWHGMAAAIAVGVTWGSPGAVAGGPIGMNVFGNVDWGTQAIWTDVTKMLRRWGTPNQPWVPDPSLTYTADGYPLQAAGAVSSLADYPDGVYKLRYEGNATVTTQWMGKMSNVVRTGNVTTADVTINHATGLPFDLEVSNVDPANPLRSMTLTMPGAVPGQIFNTAFTRRLAPFDTLRFMDLGMTNNSTLQTWSQRRTPSSSIQTDGTGIPLESMVALVNQTGTNGWFNVPAKADDDYVRNMARLVHQQMAPGRTVYVEYSNEVWNAAFSQYAQVLADAKANPALTATDDFGRVGQQNAFRAKQIGDIFRAEFGADAGRVKVVLAGQAANTYFLSKGLSFLQSTYGAGHLGIDAVAIAAYVNIPSSTDVPGLTLDGLFQALNTELDTSFTSRIKSTSSLASQYGLPMLAYEGGQHLLPWNSTANAYVNQDLKTQANHDRRMGDLLTKLNTIWAQNGGGLFDAFSSVTRDSQYGYWGQLQDITDPGSPKWDALMRLTRPLGDADLSGGGDEADLRILMSHYGQSGMWWEQGDFTGDGRVNADDLTILDLALAGQTQIVTGTGIVPEPDGGALLVGGVALMGRWRKWRR